MLKDFSSHIMDIAKHSIASGATILHIEINEEPANDLLIIIIEDNSARASWGRNSANPAVAQKFASTKPSESGIPFLEQTCSQCGGHLCLEESPVVKLTAVVQYNHADRPMMGDILSVIQSLVVANPDVDIRYTHRYNGKEYGISSSSIKRILDGVPFDTPSVSKWIKENMGEGLTEIMQSEVLL
ncbi:MAG: hypothetical protein LBU32_18890 [Clostridiales bacterium]|jgi:hypothetical protein|nr:hypothetical protein [Clostridiales bacterium]